MVSWLPSSSCQENSWFQICPDSQQGTLSRVALASPLLSKAPFAEARTHHLFQEPTPGKAIAHKLLNVNPTLLVFFFPLSLFRPFWVFMAQKLRQGNPLHYRGQVCPLSPGFLLCHKLSSEMLVMSFAEQKPRAARSQM